MWPVVSAALFLAAARALRLLTFRFEVIQLAKTTITQPTLPDGIEWPEATVRWWEHLASTPGADSWTEADWDNLMNAALIHADIWGSGNFASVPILNKLLQDYGITPAARRQITQAKVKQQERHTPLDEIAERRKLRVIEGGKAKRRTGT